MWTGRRSDERLFYCSGLRDGVGVLRLRSRIGFAAAAAALRMTVVGAAVFLTLSMGHGVRAAGPALTTISDTVYRADGTPAAGTVLISWPAFQTVAGEVVAAGNQSVEIGEGGWFTTQLVPNVGASPAGTLYEIVYQLRDYEVRTEYWSVPATATTTINAVRTTPGAGMANPAATQQYVNQAVANRALDSDVVHRAGAEIISGTKQFSVSPVLPGPVGNDDAATKAYVDGAVSNVGAGAFVAKTGDTMSGPLTLPADPVAPYQASTRHYVDNGLAAKADLVGGAVPPNQLGAGVASALTCLNGNSTWGACGGAPAGVTYTSTSLNWSQAISSALTGGTATTITLSPCPAGVDTTSGAGYQVLVSGGGNSEAANVVSGTCTSGAASGTIAFTPYFSYPAGSTVGSASSGIQETINSACGVDPTSWKNSQCNVTVPANGPGSPHSINSYSVPGTIYLHSNQSVFSGYGASLDCTGRGPCLQVGDLTNANHFGNNTVQGFSFRSPVNYSTNPSYAGVAITQTQRTSQVATITTATAHGFRPGDMVTLLFTDDSRYWGDAIVQSAPSATTFTYTHQGADIASQTTPGVVALAYEAVLDNANNTHLADISYDPVGEVGHFNNFFDFWDDENALIEHFNNNAISLNGNANWTGSFVFSGGNPPHAGQQVAAVITLRDSTITANYSNGVTVYNSNGVYVENTVLQATGPWQVYASNTTGNYQGAYLKNIYSESTASSNPASPARSPFPGTGIAGLIAGATSAVGHFTISGSGGLLGAFPSGGSGSTLYSYFIVAKDVTAGTQTSPLQVLNYKSTGSDAIAVNWPRVAHQTDTITYDVIRTTTPIGIGAIYPSMGNCTGGSTGACGAVAVNVAQCSGLVCSYSDSGSAVPQPYTFSPASGTYVGTFVFWPGSIVAVNKSVAVDVEHSNVVGVGLGSAPLQVASRCLGYGQASPGGYTTCASSNTSNTVPNQTATLMTDGAAAGGGQALSKGRLNFSTSPWAALQPHHIITLIDSQPAVTRSTTGYRPAASANDVWIGTDVPASGVGLTAGQLAFGAPVSISHYIGATGNGQNWLERLSPALKEFNVAVKFDQNVTASGGLILPQGSGYAPASGGIGLDSAAGLPVVNVGGSTHQVAFTSSNISGQAGTAAALAATPTQCSGAFATGIQANGNANCTTPNVIQLAETAQPAGIPNWGVFWFDSATHSPRVIDNNGQVVQLGMTNLFNSDPGSDPANNLEQRNGSNPQSFRVYSSYSNNTTWQRTSLGYDATNNYAVVRSENANSASAPGLGFWIGSGLKWVVDATGNYKPWTDNAFNVGSDSGNAPKSVFAKTSFNSVVYGRHEFEIANDTTAGTTLNKLAVFNSSSPSQAVTASTSSTNGVIGLVQGGAGTSGNAVIAWSGYGYCIFDNPTVAGHAVVASTTTAGDCHDTGSSAPPTAQSIGSVDVTNAASGQTVGMRIQLSAPTAALADSTAISWLTFPHGGSNISFSTATNKAIFTGAILNFPKTTSQVSYYISTADNTSNTYDLGIYSGTSGGSCTLQAHLGSTAGTTFSASTGWKISNWTGGTVTLAPGRYYLAYTTSCSSGCATLSGDTGGFTFAGSSGGANSNVSVPSGGTLPGTATCPSDVYAITSAPVWAVN